MKFFDCDEDGTWCTGVLDTICLDHIASSELLEGLIVKWMEMRLLNGALFD